MERRKVHRGEDEQFIILLNILNGVNFYHEKSTRKITLTASLESNVLKTVTRRPVTASAGTASFATRLVWVCDRYAIKRMKSENIPIKVECFETMDDERCLIGRVVIPLRSIPTFTLSRTKKATPHWYRLNVESERWRSRKPELHMLPMITDPKYLEEEHGQGSTPPPEDVGGDKNPGPGQQLTTVYINPSTEQLLGNAELLEDQCLLQIGERNTDTDLFVLCIDVSSGRHLDRFVPGADTFRLQYHLFGGVYPLNVERDEPGSAVFAVQGEISIRIRSSLAALGDYLQDTLTIVVDILPESDSPLTDRVPGGVASTSGAIGKATIDFDGFLTERDLDEFKRKYAAKKNTMEVVRNYPIRPLDEEKEKIWASGADQLPVPSLKCILSLRFLKTDDTHRAKEESQRAEEKEIDEKQQQQQASPVESTDLATVDASTVNEEKGQQQHQLETVNSTEPTSMVEGNSLPECLKTLTISRNDPQPAAVAPEKADIPSILQNTDQDLRDIPRTFAFSVRVGLIKFTSSPFAGLWQLTLQHPKADTPFTKLTLELLPDAVQPNRIDFGDVTLKLLFTTLPERAMEVIGCEPSKLTVNGPQGMHILARLDNTSLLVGTREHQPPGVVVMVDGSSGENVAIATVGCSLEEVGLNYNSQLSVAVEKLPMASACCHGGMDSGTKTARPFDENIAYRLQEEQKAWMNEHREKFLEELQQKERTHLQSLAHEWKVQRAEEEKRLADRLADAEAMASALEEAHRTLQARGQPDHPPQVDQQLERQFHEQLEAIRSKALRLEQEAEAQIKATRNQCRELQDQLATLSADNEHLVDAHLKLQHELDKERHCRAQEVSELSQRVEDISTSKLRYKEEWAKMTRKVHQLEQELAVARTPYYQSQRKEPRKTSARHGEGSQMSVLSARRHGGGDCSGCRPPGSSQ